MKRTTVSWLRDVSIAKKLYAIVGAMAVLIIIELFTLWFAIHTLSSVRSFIAAEGLWSKAQKDAVYHLGKYRRTYNEEDYLAFKSFMQVPLGDHTARVELLKRNPDFSVVRQGFIAGRIHPDDIDGMIKLVTRFHNNYHISKALEYWGQGDTLIANLLPVGEQMQQQIRSGSPSEKKLDELRLKIDAINENLTHLEDNFSYTLGEGSRWLENMILKILFSVALTVEITGLLLTFLVTRNIARGLKEINRAADRITQGHLEEKVKIFANDEIGHVAASVNRMTEQLIISNRELANFAHIASHDLQEPLRKIIVFTDLLNHELSEGITEKGLSYMKRVIDAAAGMQRLIDDVLQFAAVSSVMKYTLVDLEQVIGKVISDLEVTVLKTGAIVSVGKIPLIEANETQMQQLFQNLIGNALKFTKGKPMISITASLVDESLLPEAYREALLEKFMIREKANTPGEGFCSIYVKDNGIGFDEVYLEKIFMAFQRLHGKQEYGGTGIGLALCQKIVQNHHGNITAQSSPEQGATFIITLPLSQKQFSSNSTSG